MNENENKINEVDNSKSSMLPTIIMYALIPIGIFLGHLLADAIAPFLFG